MLTRGNAGGEKDGSASGYVPEVPLCAIEALLKDGLKRVRVRWAEMDPDFLGRSTGHEGVGGV